VAFAALVVVTVVLTVPLLDSTSISACVLGTAAGVVVVVVAVAFAFAALVVVTVTVVLALLAPVALLFHEPLEIREVLVDFAVSLGSGV
jgi:hypothetical protein